MFDRGAFLSQHKAGHHSGSNMCPGSLSVLICARKPFQRPYVPGQHYGPICAPEECSGRNGHRNVARAHMGAGMVLGHIWAPDERSGTYELRNGAGHIWAPEWCPGTYVHTKVAQVWSTV